MVIGQYSSIVGSGNRVTFPRKFSQALGNTWYITKGLDGNLIMVSEVNKEILLKEVADKPYVRKEQRERQAFVVGNTFEIVLDTANRFVIPPPLVLYAGVMKEVIFAAMGNYVQVWDSGRWSAYQQEIYPSVVKIFDELPGNEK